MKKQQFKVNFFLFLILLFNTAFFNSAAQDQKRIDSLYDALENVNNNIEKIDLLNEISKGIISDSAEKSIEIGNEALLLSRKSKYQSGEAQAGKNIGKALFYLNRYNESLIQLFSALTVAESEKDSMLN